jgi:hypothetical protein
MIQSPANSSLPVNSLLNREITGNFADFSLREADRGRKSLGMLEVFPQIPYATEQGILKSRTWNSFSASGNFQARPRKTHFLTGEVQIFRRFPVWLEF